MAKQGGKVLEITENIIKGVKLQKSIKSTIQVAFDYSDVCSLEVVLYEH